MRDPINHIPVIRRLETQRPDLYAFEIVGHVTRADVENVYGLLEEAYAASPDIDLLVRVADWEGFDWSAALTENTIARKRESLRHIRRYALVGGPGWMRAITSMMAPLFAMEIRCFEASDEAEAWAWLETPRDA